MASVLAIAAVTPPQEHPLLHELGLFSSPTSKRKLSPRRSSYFDNHSDPLQEQHAHSDSVSPAQHCGLSPRRVHSLPRAWERRPATPYVARNDAQKIWKRVPLGVVGASDEQKWRKETSKLNTRPVKRLRVTHLGEDQDKENVDYVGSKWEEDGMATPSPKRKALEYGDFSGRAWEPGQNMPNSVDIEESAEDADLHDTIDYSTASPELGTRHVSDILADEPSVEDDDAVSVALLDTILPSIDAEGPDVASIPVTHPSPASHMIGPMASPSKASEKVSTAHSGSCSDNNQDEIAIARKILASAEASLEDENAAYLWGFLSRSKARKDAQEHFEQRDPAHREAVIEVDNEAAEKPTSVYAGDASVTSPEPEDASTKLAPSMPNDLLLSPRRSSRLITRLPIPQKSLSKPTATIALKRLNGSEFVANNRETQSIAVATRTNTRSNKFGAFSVKTRLIQLTAAIEAREVSVAPLERCEASNDETVTTKRKERKEVVWAETLARYQDGSESLKDSDVRQKENIANTVLEVEEGEDRPSSPEAMPKPETNPDTETKPETLAEQSIQGLLQMLKDKDKDKSRGSIKKVRKLRRLNGGSVNGTPAPKRFMNTQLPVPVGSKIPTFGASSFRSNKPKSVDSVKVAENATEAVKNEEGVQMRTRSRNLKSV